jgi:hypothetical protein
MGLEVHMEEMSGHLAATIIGSEGRHVVEEVCRQFETVAEHCKRTKKDKVLIDTRQAEGKVSFVDRFLIGERTRIFACYGLKVVFVDRPERIDPQKFGELVARNRGVNVRIFSDFHSAEEWLLE